ncbi:E3 ubiquitin-protein ligase TTC3 isoform X2 [Cynoglossus semilaevis]|nr:E3 ubiquitin-protein ligase TTC3-like isoform X2 [Cynoglossus semilaevis]
MFNLNSPDVFPVALQWLERAGEPTIYQLLEEFGPFAFITLQVIFTEYARYVRRMGMNLERTMNELMVRPSEDIIEKSEELKKMGNLKFKNNQYEDAVKFYSRAIKYYPENHITYGNRALCYIRCEKYLKAIGDGKRATLIEPSWAKGHYRYCEALLFLGEVKKAIEANDLAQKLCRNDHAGLKDLEQQKLKIIGMLEEHMGCKPKTKNKRPTSINRAEETNSQQQKRGIKKSLTQQSQDSEAKMNKPSDKKEQAAKMNNKKDSKSSKSEVPLKNGEVESSTTVKKKMDKNVQPKEEKTPGNRASFCKELKSVVEDAYTALTNLCSRNAEQAFSKALAILETNTPKKLGLSSLDVLLLLFGRASALTEIGQLQELSEAKKVIEKIKSSEERTFQCLVYYAFGKVYLKENRFAVALEQLSDSLQMLKNQIFPGKLTWPLSKEIVKETQQDYLKERLESFIELCRFPPVPDAVCRFEKCNTSSKVEIYLTDPDFKGYIRISCCQRCSVEYHVTCWKTLRTLTFFEKNDKDFLHETCLTPDCVGRICSVQIISPTGLLKCEFKDTVLKPQTTKKLRVNQKCSSLKALKSKAEHKLKRKQMKPSVQEDQTTNDESLQQTQEGASQIQHKSWLRYRDPVLLQISQTMDLLMETKSLQVSVLVESLKPWLELDSSRGNQVADRMLNWQNESLETFSQAVELLLERKNRVWARVLIHLLSNSEDLNPKVSKWACQLNDTGLDAARNFIERYAAQLEELDLSLLLNFGPLQDMFIMNLKVNSDIFSTIGVTVTDYLQQASLHHMRLFIWTLEEHRDNYVACHTILDEYFDMDGHCSVLKKSDENQNNSPLKTKSKNRKKKQKSSDTKGLYGFPLAGTITPREEWDQDFFEDDHLSLLHPVDPFSVPSHLQDQVADFEQQYNGTCYQSFSKRFLDNHPDKTKEGLYDFFAQILEEHGPLAAEDPLLVGELQYFPTEAQQKIMKAGGLESFLLESLRFIKMGSCVGLAKQAVILQQAGPGLGLDDLDVILDHEPISHPSYTQTEIHPILPNPYISEDASGFDLNLNKNAFYYFTKWNNGDSHQQFPYSSFKDQSELCVLGTDSAPGVLETDSSDEAAGEGMLRKHAAVQTCQETMSSVAVNTEPHQSLESCQGDINKKQKTCHRLKQQIQEITRCQSKANTKLKEEIAAIEGDIQNLNATGQVINKELMDLQQRLEEDVKKDQKEKKTNQDLLKALKLEVDQVLEQQRSLTQGIREKKILYETKMNDFLELTNQSAAERMSLEEEINRCKRQCASAARRSNTAQVSTAESSREQGLYSLHRELADAKALLTKVDEAMHRQSIPGLQVFRNSWNANVQEVERKIANAEVQFKAQIDQVKNGRNVSELPLSTNQTEPSAQRSSPQVSNVQQPVAAAPGGTAAAAPPQLKQKHQHSTVFEKAMEQLSSIFPDYSRSDMMRFIQELRSSSGGSFSSMGLQDMVGGVSQLILDHQENLRAARSQAVGRGSPRATPLLLTAASVWPQVGTQRTVHPSALNVEDPCIICHEDMSPEDVCVLECRHSFHDKCIRSWLKEQSTCPTCRDHTLLPDDFPQLPGRRRPAP